MQPRVLAFTLGVAAALIALALPVHGQPPSAIGAKEKMEICKFGAADQKLTGKAEKDFINKCMANEDPPAKKSASKPAAKPATKTEEKK